MAIFPRIQSPCPYKGKLSDIMEGDTCRLCKREVVDINGFSDAERVAFLRACGDSEVCVTYRFPVRAAAAAVLAAAAMSVPMAAAAQETELDEEMIIVGGITDPAHTVFVSDAEDASVPELPVIYDDSAAANNDADTQAPSAATDLNHAVEAQ